MRPRREDLQIYPLETRAKRIGQRVKILDGMKEFVGKLGTITNYEMDGRTTMYRVTLDEPVDVPNVGLVEDDIWLGKYLRTVRS